MSRILLSDISDHFSTFTLILKTAPVINTTKSIVRSFKNFSRESFSADIDHCLNEIHLEQINEEEVNSKFTHFIDCIQKTLDKHAPYRKRTRREIRFHKKPWLTKGIRTSINTRRRLYKSHFLSRDKTKIASYKYYTNLLTKIKKGLL